MSYLLSCIFSLLGLLPYRYFILWTVVIMALFNSTHDTSQQWGDYHYFIGAKYFSELGYYDLYECSVNQPTPRRDLTTYNFRFDAPHCTAQFTPQRYLTFKIDLARVGFKPDMMVDKGFNATPTWIAIAQSLLINTGIATTDNLYLFDLLALLVAALVLIWAVGWERTAYVALFVLTFYGTQDRLWGHFAQWLWLACALIGVALLYRGKAWGGIFIGCSIALAIFPIFLVLMYLKNRLALIWAVFGLCFFLLIGLGTSRGLNAYSEFIHDMSLHSSYVKTELCCNVGLAHTITWTLNPDSTYLHCFATAENCQERYKPMVNNLLWQVLVPLVLTSPLGAMFGLLTLSGYYYLILSVIPVWYGVRWTKIALVINSIIFVWGIVDYHGSTVYAHWLWFIYFMVLGVTEHHVIQTIAFAVDAIQQRLHTQVAAWNAGD